MPSLDLKPRQGGECLAINLNRSWSDFGSIAIARKEIKKSRVAEVFLQICAAVQIVGIDLGDRKTVAAEVSGKFEKGNVFFAHVVKNADRGLVFPEQSDDPAPGAAKLPLQGIDTHNRPMEVLLEEFF